MENTHNYKRVVIKLGTSTITGHTSHVDQPVLLDLIRQIAELCKRGISVTLVSSGAVAAGREALNYPSLPKHIPAKQMLSAIGQPRLMAVYNKIFRMYGLQTAQILLTRSDFTRRAGYLNARNTLEGLLQMNVIPIINENDTVSINELKLGDNDSMSALVSGLVGADLLVLVTDRDGIYTADPSKDPNAKRFDLIDTPEIPEEMIAAAGNSVSGLGTGGMITKVTAADLARRMGTTVMVVSGSEPDVLIRAVENTAVGTVFKPVNSLLDSRKRFILTDYRSGTNIVRVDSGAAQALLRGKSLLPAGVVEVIGSFERGDTVSVSDENDREICVGVSNYPDSDIRRLIGQKTSMIESVLGYTLGDEIVHHDFMIFN